MGTRRKEQQLQQEIETQKEYVCVCDNASSLYIAYFDNYTMFYQVEKKKGGGMGTRRKEQQLQQEIETQEEWEDMLSKEGLCGM